MSWRRFVTRVTTLVVWRSSANTARKLYGFALAEQGSAIDLSMAAQLESNAERAAAYLQHAMDESRHATMFARRAAELRERGGLPSYGAPRADVDHLYVALGPVAFLAFVHRGERRARTQFEVYQRYFEAHGDTKTASVFARVLEDERRHEQYTLELLQTLAGGKAAATRALWRSARWEAGRTWLRHGRSLSRRAFTVAMWILYVAIAPIALAFRLRAARASTGWR